MFSGTHYGIKVDMGWLKDDVDGLKQVVDFLNKDNIKFVLLPVANQRFKLHDFFLCYLTNLVINNRFNSIRLRKTAMRSSRRRLSPPTSHTTGHAVPHPAVQLT